MNSSCQEISEKMIMYIDGCLDNKENQIFKEHIDECLACQKEFNSLSMINSFMTDLPKLEDKCPETELIVRFAESDITFTEGKEIKKHLENCANCREEVTFLLELNQNMEEKITEEITERQIIPAYLVSAVQETYGPFRKKSIKQKTYTLSNMVYSFFGNRRVITALTSCFMAFFMALSGIFQLSTDMPVPTYETQHFSLEPTGIVQMNKPLLETSVIKEESLYNKDIQGNINKQFSLSNNSKSCGDVENTKLKSDRLVDSIQHLENTISDMKGISRAILNYDKSMVKVKLYNDYPLSSVQISNIISLISTSLGNISFNNINIIDATGISISDNILFEEKKEYLNLTEEQRLKQQNFEEILIFNVKNALEETFGNGNVFVQISSILDFIVNEPIFVPGRTLLGMEEFKSYNTSQIFSSKGLKESSVDKVNNINENFKYKSLSFNVLVYPPGIVKKLKVYVALNGIKEFNKAYQIIAKSAGINYDRGDIVNVENISFINETLPEKNNDPKENFSDVPVKYDSGYSKLFGIISIILAVIFLSMGIKNIFKNERYVS